MIDWPADANNSDYQEEEQTNRSDSRVDEYLVREVSTLLASTRRSTATETRSKWKNLERRRALNVKLS